MIRAAHAHRTTRASSFSRWSAYLFTPVLTAFVLLVAMATSGIAPFGDHVMLCDDASLQYVGFFGWYSEVLHGNEDLFYSVAKGLGGATFSLFAYYLASPFSLIAGLFDPSEMAYAFSLVYPAKIIVASLTMCVYVRSRHELPSASSVVLSCAYALAACNLGAGSNVMWLDGVIMLPLACLGAHRLLTSGKPFLLVFSVAVTVLANWYAGYMVCLALVVYFFCECVLLGLAGKKFVSAGFRFAFAIIIGLFISMPFFLPVIVDMLGDAGISNSGYMTTIREHGIVPAGILDVLKSFTMDIGPADALIGPGNISPHNFPLAGCVLFLATAFFFITGTGREGRKKRIVFGIVAALMLASFVFKPLDMIWTGFTRADSYNPRYMFVFVFFLISMAAYACEDFAAIGWKRTRSALIGAALVVFALFVFFALKGWEVSFAVVAAQSVLVICTVAGIVGLAMVRHRRSAQYEGDGKLASAPAYRAYESRRSSVANEVSGRGAKVFVCAAIAVMVVAFSVEGSYIETRMMQSQYENTSGSAFRTYMQKMDAELTDLRQSAGFLRVGYGFDGSVKALESANKHVPSGEALAFGVSNLTHYSSAGSQVANDLIGNMGYCLTPGTRAITNYRSSQFFADALLGVNVSMGQTAPFAADPTNALGVYENPHALPLGYRIDPSASSFEWGSDPLSNQVALASSMTGLPEQDLFIWADTQKTLADDGSCSAFSITPVMSGPVYVTASSPATVSLVYDGEVVQTIGSWAFDTNVMYLGDHQAGETFVVKCFGDDPEVVSSVEVWARTLDADLALGVLSALADEPLDLRTYDNGSFSGTTSFSEAGQLLVTVPFEREWRATVDGAPVEIRSYQSMMVIDVPAGVHEVEFTFGLPSGLLAGSALCVASLLVCVVWGCIRKYRARK